MAIHIDITPDKLRGTASDVITAAEHYGETCDDLYECVSRMQTEWQGVDNQRYTQQIRDFRPHLENLKDLMKNYADYLKISADAFDETQAEVKSKAGYLVN